MMMAEKSRFLASVRPSILAVLLLSAAVLTSVQAEEQVQVSYPMKRIVRICGVKLVDMMKQICNHCYRTVKPKTRSYHPQKREIGGYSEDEDELTNGQEELMPNTLPELNTYIEKRWGGGTRPRQVGIADKCCLSQCTYADLTTYCCNKSGR